MYTRRLGVAFPEFSLRTALSVSAALLLLLLVVEPLARADEKPKDAPVAVKAFESEHYRLYTNIDAATSEEYSRVIETAWPLLEEFFGAAPKLKKGEKLDVYFLASQEDWQAQMKGDGVGIPMGAGGYYWPGNKTVYLWKQPTLYTSRQLLLHECMHQFHYLACCDNKGPKDVWYIEGVVEHLSRHYWDGERLTLGVVPFCSLEDYPRLALELYQRDDYDLAALISGERASARPEQWALVRYLLQQGEAKQWAGLRKKLDGGQEGRNVFKKHFGDPKKLQPKIHEWLKTQQEPFVPVWNEWQGQGADAVLGTATVTSACRARDEASELSATLHVPEGAWKGGLLVGFSDADNYTVALLNSEGGFSINQRANGAWNVLKRGDAPPAVEGKYRLKAVRKEGSITLSANDVELGSFELQGNKLGVCLENCTLRFTEIAWK
ncbi:MAG: hypothetical protein ICCCNLDF_01977 [Planctomycetes bacterium]|nr:hypothetical protein [Planctomycetota bacterium]